MTGSGTLADPYIIWDVNDLQAMENDLTAYYELGQDIDASATVGWNAGLGFLTLGGWAGIPFTGQLDGKWHKVTGLYFNVLGFPRYAGLFYEISAGSTVQNLSLEDVNIAGSSNSCGAFGKKNDGTLEKCYATGEIVADTAECGGLIQENSGIIRKCYSEVNVDNYAGGVHGHGGDAGGLVCDNSGDIIDCYARGSVRAYGYAGGLVNMSSGTISKCYSTGAVFGDDGAGGLVESGNTTTNSFWDTETSGQAASDGGTGKTTAEMKTAPTFISAGWSFGTIWGMTSACNDGYACLLDVTPSCAYTLWKGNIVIDQLIYQHAERMRR